MLKNKHIVIGVTGGIAAYKIPLLVRELKKAGADIRVVMSEAAREFVTPLTLSTLSGSEVVIGTFPSQQSQLVDARTWHIKLGQWADVMLIAPATANVLAKLAHGYADDAVSTLALALRCPLVISPSMDLDMWHHEATRLNVAALQELGYIVLPPEEGELASGLTGPGRLPELSSIVAAVDRVLDNAHRDLKGKSVLISAGPTHEPIDPVRFIGNRSSGRMGFALATAASQRGAEVTLVAGPVHLPTPRNVKRIDVATAGEMYHAIMKRQSAMDVIIMAAAVADFAPEKPSNSKIKKQHLNGAGPSLTLRRTKDILGELSLKKNKSLRIGFALETENGLGNARKKLKEKKLDLVVLNNANEEGAGFEVATNIVTIIWKNGKTEKLRKMPKYDVAQEILNRIARLARK